MSGDRLWFSSRTGADSALIASRFETLKDKWAKETANTSSVSEIILNDSYQQIIGMGPDVLPEILQSLEAELAFWFPALKSISGEDPVPVEAAGDLEAMRDAWLKWGRAHGYLQAG